MVNALRVSQMAPDWSSKLMKGIGFANVQAFVQERYGYAAWGELVRSLTPSDRAELGAIVAVGWYDSYLFGRLLRRLDEKHGRGDLKLLREVGAYEAQRDFNRVLRVLMRIASPLQMFRTHARLWSHFQASGSWTMLPLTGGGMRATLDGWAVDDALCAELTGYLGKLIEFTGGRQVSVDHKECRARRAPACVFEFWWD